MAETSETLDFPKKLPSGQPVNLLLVDDEPANLLALEAILQDLCLNLVKASSGEEALRRLLDADFAAILLDVQMQGLDGFETAKLIRGHQKFQYTPIIFLTAYDNNRLPAAEAYQLGAVDYLVKPVVPVVLRAKVASFVELFQKAEQFKRQGEQFRLLIEGTKEYAIFMLDPHGHVLTWNPGGERINGYKAEEIIGEHFSRFYPAEYVESGKPQQALEVASSQGKYEAEGWRLRKDGSRFWASVVITALWDEAGSLRGFSKVTRDMTERKQAEGNARRLLQEQAARKAAEEAEWRLRESEQRFARFMQQLPGLAWIKDVDGRYVYANDAAVKAFQKPREELYGKTDPEVFPPDVAAQFQENDRRALASETGVGVIETLEHEDGTLHHSLVSKFPIPGPDGQVALVGGMAIDITDRLRAEEALKDADRRKDQFLAVLAHELRNPLAPIRNGLQIMQLAGNNRAAAGQAREMMERQIKQMVRLTDDLLDLSRISRGKVELRKERVELAAVVRSAIEMTRPMIEAGEHQLTVTLPEEPVHLQADSVRLAQVVGNLLNNAAKYTDQGGHICLSAQPEGREVVVRVKDNGIGIAAEMLPRIFEMFSQVNRTPGSSQGGLGIGLSLVKSLVEMHGGGVEVQSAGFGQGSEFVVRLPIRAQDQAGAGAGTHEEQNQPARALPSRRVLVVDDNVDAAESLAMLLRLQGQEVAVAYDGPTALEKARAAQPTLAFLDIGMPGMDGHELARRLRQEPELGNLVLIALTGWGQEEDRRRSREAGFNVHLTKPASPDTLQEILAHPSRFAAARA